MENVPIIELRRDEFAQPVLHLLLEMADTEGIFERTKSVLLYIRSNLFDLGLNVEHAKENCGIGKHDCRFNGEFRKQVGHSIYCLIRSCRIRIAKRLALSPPDFKVQEISASLGYRRVNTLFLHLRHDTGKSLTAFRKDQRAERGNAAFTNLNMKTIKVEVSSMEVPEASPINVLRDNVLTLIEEMIGNIEAIFPTDITNALCHIHDSLFERSLCLAEIERMCDIENSRFSKRFEECVGHSPSKFIHLCRTWISGHLLLNSQNYSLQEIGAAVGYGGSNDSLFVDAFQACSGIHPNAFASQQ